MTLKEFVEKYHVPYNTVYNTTYKVKSYSSWMHDREYPEKELYKEAVRQTEEKIKKHKQDLKQQCDILANLKKYK